MWRWSTPHYYYLLSTNSIHMRVYRFSYVGYTHGWCVSPPRAAPHRRCQARPNGPPLREVFLVGRHSCDVVAAHYVEMRCSQRGTRLNWTASQLDWTPLQPLLSPFIPVPSYVQHLLMPAADPHRGDTLNGSLIRILVTLGHASQHGNTRDVI